MKKNQYKFNERFVSAKNIAVLTAVVLSVESLWANAFRDPNQDPEAIGRGDAFVATADDPAAIYYNPAGITQLPGIEVGAGIYLISEDTSFSSSAAGGGSAKTDTTPQPVPQLYATWTLTNAPLSFGLGVYAPYGLSLNYGNSTPISSVAEQGNLTYLSFNPVVAWKICPTLSIAIGPNFNYSEVMLQQNPFYPANARFHYHGSGWDPGYNAGILWQPTPMWSFGLNYRSSTEIKYSGNASQTFGFPFSSSTTATAVIPFPEYITGGVSLRPTTNWNFEFDLDWTKWSEIKTLTLNNTPLGNVPVPLNYQNSFIYEFGVTRQICDGYYASVGYEYSENSSPDASFNPLIPDSNLSLGGVGVGHHGKRWDWAAAFQFAYGGRTVSGDTAYPSADGTYRTFNKAVNISGTYKF
jgi:long-chain fatty acid transport protein